ncbi:MAG: hypothetical protein ACFNUL_02730 [Cardiobacterium hominis]
MNALLEDILAGALLITVTIVPGGEDNPPAVVRTESHREWVREQCARHDLTDDEITACKNFWESDK